MGLRASSCASEAKLNLHATSRQLSYEIAKTAETLLCKLRVVRSIARMYQACIAGCIYDPAKNRNGYITINGANRVVASATRTLD